MMSGGEGGSQKDKKHGNCYDEDVKAIADGGGRRALFGNNRQKSRKTKTRSTADTAICIHIARKSNGHNGARSRKLRVTSINASTGLRTRNMVITRGGGRIEGCPKRRSFHQESAPTTLSR
jgi:hypothetical protein